MSYQDDKIRAILQANEELHRLKDVDTILDKVLLESRRICNAEAGSIFLTEGDKLRFSYVQNDILFKEDETNVAMYMDFAIPIDEASIVGYAAKAGQLVKIDDAYNIPENVPYRFNTSFDEKSGYRTVSILTIPLKSWEDRLVGVMQLINACNENGKPIPFSQEDQLYMPLFANNATIAIERGQMNRELILRMMKMAELRDPSETGAHVQRVGAYSAEIYAVWGKRHSLSRREIKNGRDNIRLAAMLHDVGKVGISDFILKKPGKLTEEEYNVMKWHTVYGARLFVNHTSDLDRMSREIALNHHEKWAGGGYPGKIGHIFQEAVVLGTPKQGEEISIEARITALADVFDALSSRRSYKEPWPDEKILSIIEQDSGTHFDPEVGEIFFEIWPVMKAIREKYGEDKATS